MCVCTQADADEKYAPRLGQAGKDAVWAPTPQVLVDTMLNMANVTSSDYVIDLGSGDGRLVIAAAKRGATALGIEYNPDLVEFARRAATEAGVSTRATFEKADILESDFSKATVITLFMLPDTNLKLRPIILNMKPGTRIVANTYGMGGWEPDQTTNIVEYCPYCSVEAYCSDWHIAHLWIVPARVNGIWKFDEGQIRFTQEFQHVSGNLTTKKAKMKLIGKLDGDKLTFAAGGTEYIGTVSDNMISGTRAGGGVWQATR